MSKKEQTPEPRQVNLPNDLDLDDFLQPACDDRGHNSRLIFRTPPAIAEQAAIFASHSKLRYRTTSDLMRHALIRHLRWLHVVIRGLGDTDVNADRLKRSEALTAVLREEEANSEFHTTMDRLQSLVNQLVSQGEQRRASLVVHRCLNEVNAMGEAHWRKKYSDSIRIRFSIQLDSAPKLSLVRIAQQGIRSL